MRFEKPLVKVFFFQQLFLIVVVIYFEVADPQEKIEEVAKSQEVTIPSLEEIQVA